MSSAGSGGNNDNGNNGGNAGGNGGADNTSSNNNNTGGSTFGGFNLNAAAFVPPRTHSAPPAMETTGTGHSVTGSAPPMMMARGYVPPNPAFGGFMPMLPMAGVGRGVPMMGSVPPGYPPYVPPTGYNPNVMANPTGTAGVGIGHANSGRAPAPRREPPKSKAVAIVHPDTKEVVSVEPKPKKSGPPATADAAKAAAAAAAAAQAAAAGTTPEEGATGDGVGDVSPQAAKTAADAVLAAVDSDGGAPPTRAAPEPTVSTEAAAGSPVSKKEIKDIRKDMSATAEQAAADAEWVEAATINEDASGSDRPSVSSTGGDDDGGSDSDDSDKEEWEKKLEEPASSSTTELVAAAAAAPEVPTPTYEDGMWAPSNPEGRKVYGRDFLLQFRPLCMDRPESLPPIDVILGVNETRETVQAAVPRRNNKNSNRSRKGNRGNRSDRGYNNNSNKGRRDNRSGGRRSGGRGGNNHGRQNRSNATIRPEDVKPLESSANAWKPSHQKGSGAEEEADTVEVTVRKAKAILNKLSPDTFEKMAKRLTECGIDNLDKLNGVIDLLFEKAVDEKGYVRMYADLADRLSHLSDGFGLQEGEVAGDEGDMFRRCLLARCQHHFESKRELTAEERAELDQMEIDYLEMRFRMKRIGNMRFVGELFNTNLLAGRIIKVCLEVLLSGESTTVEDDIEGACMLLETCGRKFARSDASQKQPVMPSFVARMEELSEDKRISSRVRFRIKDVLDLKRRNWIQREGQKVKGPKKIEEIHQEAEREAQEAAIARERGRHRGGRNSRDGRDRKRSKHNKFDRGVQAQRNRRGPRGNRSKNKGNDGEWKTGTGKSLGRVDPSKVKLGPSGGRPGGFGRGAAGWQNSPSAAKKEERPKINVNATSFFALLGDMDDDGDAEESGSASDESGSESGSGSGSAAADASADGGEEESEDEGEEADDETMLKRTRAIVSEYFNLLDTAEAKQCVEEELGGSVNYAAFVNAAFVLVAEEKVKDAKALGALFLFLLSEGVFKARHVEAGIASFVEPLVDFAIDVPHAPRHFGYVVGMLVAGGVLSADYPNTEDFASLKGTSEGLKFFKFYAQGILESEGQTPASTADLLLDGGMDVWFWMSEFQRGNERMLARHFDEPPLSVVFPLRPYELELLEKLRAGEDELLAFTKGKVTSEQEGRRDFATTLVRSLCVFLSEKFWSEGEEEAARTAENAYLDAESPPAIAPIAPAIFLNDKDRQIDVLRELLRNRMRLMSEGKWRENLHNPLVVFLYDCEWVAEEVIEAFVEEDALAGTEEAKAAFDQELTRFLEVLAQTEAEDEDGN